MRRTLVIASGTALDYFTGAHWGLSERFFGCVITREGDPAWVTPAFEKARALEQVKIGKDVRAWEEHESPSALVAAIDGVARKIRDVLRAKLDSKAFSVEVDDGEDVLVKKAHSQPNFGLKLVSNSVKAVRINLDRE